MILISYILIQIYDINMIYIVENNPHIFTTDLLLYLAFVKSKTY